MTSSNQRKHESNNPIQRALIRRFHAAVISMLRIARPRTILDLGCGEGYVLGEIVGARLGASLTGIDRSALAIEQARGRLGPAVSLERGDAWDLADRGRKFDVVMMLEVLEHVPDPGGMISVLEGLCGEYVLLSVPREPYFRSLNLLRGKNLRRLGNDPEHINHWSRRGFRRFVSAGFEVVEMPSVFPWVMVLARRTPA